MSSRTVATTAPDGPRLLAPHAIVLILLAGAAVLVAHHAGSLHEGALAAGSVGPDVRQALAFGMFFNLGIGLLIAAAFAAEVLVALVRVARRRSGAGHVLGRLVLSTLPALAFAGGHLLLNARLLALGRPLLGG